MKQQKIPFLMIVAIIVMIVMLGISTVVAIVNPAGHSYRNTVVIQKGLKGDTPEVDYKKIDKHIDKEVATLPKPINGSNGKNGAAGKPGKDGSNGLPGIQGITGVAGKTIELRHDDLLHDTEWRYQGDLAWKVLVKDCTITNTCVSL